MTTQQGAQHVFCTQVETTRAEKSLARNLTAPKAGACWPGTFWDTRPWWGQLSEPPLPSRHGGAESPRGQHGWGCLHTSCARKAGQGWWDRIPHGLCPQKVPGPSMTKAGWEEHPALAQRRGGSAGSWEGRLGSTASSITDMSSRSRETPCLKGLISM